MYRRPYVESSVFIAYIRGELRAGHDCKAVFDTILDAATAGDFRIFTSALTIAEVFKNKRDGVQLTSRELDDLRPYFRESYIALIEVDRDIAERANELCRTHITTPAVPPLRPNDAIHIASAERAECEVVLAYDRHFTRQTHDRIRIEWPQRLSLFVMPEGFEIGPGQPAVQQSLALPPPAEEVLGQALHPDDEKLKPPPMDDEPPPSLLPEASPTPPDGIAVDGKPPSVSLKLKEEGPSGFNAPDPLHAVIADEKHP